MSGLHLSKVVVKRSCVAAVIAVFFTTTVLLACCVPPVAARAPTTPAWMHRLGLTPFVAVSLCDVAYDNSRMMRGGAGTSIVHPTAPGLVPFETGFEIVATKTTTSGAGFTAFYDSRRYVLVVAFRGDQARSFAYDGVTDFEAAATYVPWSFGASENVQEAFIHPLLSKRYEQLRVPLMGLLERYYEAEDIVLLGHSVGAGIATVAATDLGMNVQTRISCATFGSPRIGSERVAFKFRARVKHYNRFVTVCEGCLKHNPLAKARRWECYDKMTLNPSYEKNYHHVDDDAVYVEHHTHSPSYQGTGFERVLHDITTYEAALYSGDVPAEVVDTEDRPLPYIKTASDPDEL
jgi:hypothetical protein